MDITFGATQELGAIAGWNDQTPDRGTTSDRKHTLDKDGNETDSHVHNPKVEVNVPYTADTDGTVALPGTIGAILNSLVLTQIQINTTAEDYAKMSLQAHNHSENAHTACRTGTHGLAALNGFGATDFLGGTAGTDAAVESASLTVKCEHVDITGDQGTHVDGENYHATIEAETTWHGVPDVEADTAAWDKITSQTKTNNQGMKTTTVKGTKALDLA